MGETADSLGDALSYEEALPLAWRPLAAAPEAEVMAENELLLKRLAALGAGRPAGTEEPGTELAHEFARLEAKLDLLLEAMAAVIAAQTPQPAIRQVRLSAETVVWLDPRPPAVGDAVLIELYLFPFSPKPLRLPAHVVSAAADGAATRVTGALDRLGEGVKNELEKLIFRHHRRRIALTRHHPAP